MLNHDLKRIIRQPVPADVHRLEEAIKFRHQTTDSCLLIYVAPTLETYSTSKSLILASELYLCILLTIYRSPSSVNICF